MPQKPLFIEAYFFTVSSLITMLKLPPPAITTFH